jgi:hypothetical protein
MDGPRLHQPSTTTQPAASVGARQRVSPGLAGQEEWSPVAGENPRPLIPPGEYDAICTKAGRREMVLWKRAVIALEFRVFEGPYMNTQVERFYPAKNRVGRSCAYYREWSIAAGRAPRRGERMRPSKFLGKLFRVEVQTVASDQRQNPLPPPVQYSKVARLLELLATNEADP